MAERTRPDPTPFFLEGGPSGALLIHGFTGSPPEMRLVGQYLHERGLTVSAPLLPGHGTSADDLNRCRWSDWTGRAQAALAELRRLEKLAPAPAAPEGPARKGEPSGYLAAGAAIVFLAGGALFVVASIRERRGLRRSERRAAERRRSRRPAETPRDRAEPGPGEERE